MFSITKRDGTPVDACECCEYNGIEVTLQSGINENYGFCSECYDDLADKADDLNTTVMLIVSLFF
jgi:hypothetical protein